MKRAHRKLDTALKRGDNARAIDIIRGMTDHEKDLLVPCPCGAAEAEECVGTERRLGKSEKTVHFGRRLARMLKLCRLEQGR